MENTNHLPPPPLTEWVAHTPTRDHPDQWHSLVDHTLGVTQRAEAFARPFGGEEAARYLGQIHDLGKFTDEFQQYLLDCHLNIPRQPGSAPHKQHGAQAVLNDFGKSADIVAAVVHGHHGGIKDRSQLHQDIHRCGITSELIQELRQRAATVHPDFAGPPPAPNVLIPPTFQTSACDAEMYLRFVFSALVDADALDTESHTNPEASQARSSTPPSLAELKDTLLRHQKTAFSDSPATPVNLVRREVYDFCRRVAKEHLPGVFSLTVPTGGGKTRSSLAFALEHAVQHDLRRVIYAIPFTSIVDQTAQVFQSIFGADTEIVLEHHSAVEHRLFGDGETIEEERTFDKERWRLLAAENWDAPIVVTTTVQLFESLFSNRPSACRKLHRLAKSVLILDEVQTLPPTLLSPLLSGLKTLTEKFGVTVVLCTATQPALSVKSSFLDGFDRVTPIIAPEHVSKHFASLRRVRYQVAVDPWSWQTVADTMRSRESALCIANTRRHALELLDTLDPDGDDSRVFHLSTLLCGRHRKQVLATIRQRLSNKQPTLLVSTQVVEAGVDLDFPRVLRALAPLDRIIQAAGRCNREGLRPRDTSEVIIFIPEYPGIPNGLYKMASDLTRLRIEQALSQGEVLDFDDPQLVTDWFTEFYTLLRQEVDRQDVQNLREKFNFPEVARRVRLIDDDTLSVLVLNLPESLPGAVQEAQAILREAQYRGTMTRTLWRRAQPLCVSVRRKDAEQWKETVPGLRVWHGDYHPKKGLPINIDPADSYRTAYLFS